MAIYAVTINGENFPACVLPDANGLLGFFASRVVEASNPAKAELLAVDMIKKEYMSVLSERLPDDPDPMMFLDEIMELEQFPEDFPQTGATWYPMGS